MSTGRILTMIMLTACLVPVFASCGGEENLPPTAAFNLNGQYQSTAAVGDLGVLTLFVLERETAGIYDTVLRSNVSPAIEDIEGVATIGGTHLIINFDRGSQNDFYFEGEVTAASGSAQSINGQFIFPDSEPRLSATFERR
jgi:hypothetical protein